MPGLNSRLRYSPRLLARCEWDKVHTNVDIHIPVRELSITRQDIRDILTSFDLGLIYQHVSESFETRQEQVESVEDEINVLPFTLSFSSCLMLSRRECKPGIKMRLECVRCWWKIVTDCHLSIWMLVDKLNYG